MALLFALATATGMVKVLSRPRGLYRQEGVSRGSEGAPTQPPHTPFLGVAENEYEDESMDDFLESDYERESGGESADDEGAPAPTAAARPSQVLPDEKTLLSDDVYDLDDDADREEQNVRLQEEMGMEEEEEGEDGASDDDEPERPLGEDDVDFTVDTGVSDAEAERWIRKYGLKEYVRRVDRRRRKRMREMLETEADQELPEPSETTEGSDIELDDEQVRHEARVLTESDQKAAVAKAVLNFEGTIANTGMQRFDDEVAMMADMDHYTRGRKFRRLGTDFAKFYIEANGDPRLSISYAHRNPLFAEGSMAAYTAMHDAYVAATGGVERIGKRTRRTPVRMADERFTELDKTGGLTGTEEERLADRRQAARGRQLMRKITRV